MIPTIRGGASFRGSASYYLADKRSEKQRAAGASLKTSSRVAWVETRNCAADDPRGAIDEMWRTARDGPALKRAAGLRQGRDLLKPVKTIALAWHPDERPNRAAMRAAADAYLAAMGWQEHQAVIVCHTDTKHPHLHIILNRVHPVTGRTLDDGNERIRSQSWALGYELAHGLVFCTARSLDEAARRQAIDAARDQRNRQLVEPVLAVARTLAGRAGHALSDEIGGRELNAEQRRAAQAMLAGADLVAVTGYAGTGKTRLLARARRGWEVAGYNVRGVALSGIAARNLEQGSGIASRTIASLEHAWGKDRDRLGSSDILVVDEAGMVGAVQMQRLLNAAERAGAKVVLIGDPEQLQPINSAAPYRAIIQSIVGTELTEIRRQTAEWQRQATRELATQQTARAIARYDAEGMVHPAKTAAEARSALVEQWDQDRRERPDADRIILAQRRADVAKLNALAREKMRAAGQLDRDCVLTTATGDAVFAVGDRIVFTRNDRELDINNGTRAVITGLTAHRLTARILQEGPQRTVSVALGDYTSFQHGYALTVHKAQGVTVEQAYVLASRQYDRHIAYVALSRHRERVDLHYASTDFADVDRLGQSFSRAPLPSNTTRQQAQADDIFCAERMQRDYAAAPRHRTRGAGAGHTPPDRPGLLEAERRFTEAEQQLEADARTPRQERNQLAERHQAERDHFFAERRAFIKALRGEVYVRAREELRDDWRRHHQFRDEINAGVRAYAGAEELRARSAASESDIDLAKIHLKARDDIADVASAAIAANRDQLIEFDRAAIRARQNEAAAAFINERYSDYAAIKERQQTERAELKVLQAKRDKGERFDGERLARLTTPFVAPKRDLTRETQRINDILDRLEIVRDVVPGADSMANRYDPLREAEEQAMRDKRDNQQIDEARGRFAALAHNADVIAQSRTVDDRGPPEDPQRQTRVKSYARELETTAETAKREEQRQQHTCDNRGTGDGASDADRQAEQRRAEEAARLQREAEAAQRRQAESEAEARFRAEYAAYYRDAGERSAQALGRHYDVLRPYQSMAAAAGHEHELFLKERHEARTAIAAEIDPEYRQILILADRANVAEYQGHLAHRNARMSEVISGRFANAQSWAERQSAHERFTEAMRRETGGQIREDGEVFGQLGNAQAERDYRTAQKQRGIAADLKAEIRARTEAWQRQKMGGPEPVTESQRARTQETQQASSTIDPRDMAPWIAEKARQMQREQQGRAHFSSASKEASRTQATQADRTEDEAREQKQDRARRHGH